MKSSNSPQQSFWLRRKFILGALLAIVIIIGIYFARQSSVIQSLNVDSLRATINAQGIWAPVLFIGLYVVAVVLFLPATPFTILAGSLFGVWLGTIYAVIGATIGATLAFFVARFFGEALITQFLKQSFPKLSDYDETIKNNGLRTVLFLRLIPLFPFNALNFALGLTRVRPLHYIVGTLIGIIPGSFALAYLGASLVSLSPWKIATAVALFIVLLLIGPLYNRLNRKQTKNKTTSAKQ